MNGYVIYDTRSGKKVVGETFSKGCGLEGLLASDSNAPATAAAMFFSIGLNAMAALGVDSQSDDSSSNSTFSGGLPRPTESVDADTTPNIAAVQCSYSDDQSRVTIFQHAIFPFAAVVILKDGVIEHGDSNSVAESLCKSFVHSFAADYMTSLMGNLIPKFKKQFRAHLLATSRQLLDRSVDRIRESLCADWIFVSNCPMLALAVRSSGLSDSEIAAEMEKLGESNLNSKRSPRDALIACYISSTLNACSVYTQHTSGTPRSRDFYSAGGRFAVPFPMRGTIAAAIHGVHSLGVFCTFPSMRCQLSVPAAGNAASCCDVQCDLRDEFLLVAPVDSVSSTATSADVRSIHQQLRFFSEQGFAV